MASILGARPDSPIGAPTARACPILDAMGLTRAQKMRKHGERAAEAATGTARDARARPAAPRPDSSPAPAQGRDQRHPDPSRSTSSPMLIVGVVMVIGVLFVAYVNLVVLTGFATELAGGYGPPELRLTGFSQEWFQGFVQAMADDGPAAYRSVHWSTGLLAPLVLAAGWALFVVLQSRRGHRVFRWVGLAVVVAFLAVYLLGSAVLDRAVAAPSETGLVTAASLLMSLRGALFLAMIALLVWAMVNSVRRIANDLAEQGRATRTDADDGTERD